MGGFFYFFNIYATNQNRKQDPVYADLRKQNYFLATKSDDGGSV